MGWNYRERKCEHCNSYPLVAQDAETGEYLCAYCLAKLNRQRSDPDSGYWHARSDGASLYLKELVGGEAYEAFALRLGDFEQYTWRQLYEAVETEIERVKEQNEHI